MQIRTILLALTTLLPATAISQDTRWVTQVTDLYPSLSPDGTTLAFQSSRLGAARLFLSDTSGRNVRALTGTPGQITPMWSPDGRRIAFAGFVDGQLEVFIADAGGANVRRITSDPAADMHPHWSADGTRLFFNSNRNGAGGPPLATHEVYSVGVDGHDLRKHTDCRAICTYPAPSPDGTRIVYRRELPRAAFDWDLTPTASDSEIMIASIDGTGERNLSNSSGFDGWPAWSPDGGWVVFASNRLGPANTGQLFAIRPDGSGLRQLTSGPWSHAQPNFSSDGRTIYMFKLQEGTAYQYGFIASLAVPPGMR